MKRVLGVGLAIAMAMSIALSAATAADTVTAMGPANYKETKGNIYSWCGFPGPCTVPTSAIVLLEKQGPAEVIIGDTFSYQIQISNRSAMDMIAVTLDDVLPEGFMVDSIEPKPTKNENGRLFWDLGTVPAKSAKLITICGRAVQLGCLVSNAMAKICYEMPLPLVTRVVQCNVEIRKTLPEVADLCDVIPMCLTVSNIGSAPATNVCITDDLPEGLLTKDGKSSINIAVGTIPVGGYKTFSIDLQATKRGSFTNTAVAIGDRNCRSESSATVKVVAPELQVNVMGPMDGYICTTIPYEIIVTNTGDSPAQDVILVDCVTPGFSVEKVSHNGKVDRKNRIVWNLGTIAPNESVTVCVWGSATAEGQYGQAIEVTARCAQPKNVNTCITLVGVPGVLTSLRDNCDPVIVGGQVTYTITASNTGTRDATKLDYVIELDEGMEYLGGEGATPVTQVDKKKLTFATLPVLPKGATATWTVTVKATSVGDKRFVAKLSTGELQSPVAKAESTNFYQPQMAIVSSN